MAASNAMAQAQTQVIQFTGVVVGADGSTPLPGVHIYVPKAGRGTTTNIYGYFSMPSLAGDSVVVSSIGYQRQSLIIPQVEGDKYTAMIELKVDTTFLSPVDVFPYPTEELLKQAILAMDIPVDQYAESNQLGREVLAEMLRTMPMDAATNYKYYQQQQFMRMHNRFNYTDPTQALLNPFAWANLIKAIKNGDFKNKDKKKKK